MADKIITPLCTSQHGESEAFDHLAKILDTPAAKRLGLRGIAQRYKKKNGSGKKDGKPVLLMQDGNEEYILDPARAQLTDQGLQKDRKEITKLAAKIEYGRIHTASGKIWLLIFPGISVMQADNLQKDLDIADNLLMRQRPTYATISVKYPDSHHEALITFGVIQNAMRTLHKFRAKEIAEAEAAGYAFGDLSYEDLLASNQDSLNWNVSAVTNMSNMFSNNHSLSQDISKWDVSRDPSTSK